eukprot:Amastigsp_a388_12.p8 type:complete len:123 gc:universal Amastigsp_a388_12:2521-2889(+)
MPAALLQLGRRGCSLLCPRRRPPRFRCRGERAARGPPEARADHATGLGCRARCAAVLSGLAVGARERLESSCVAAAWSRLLRVLRQRRRVRRIDCCRMQCVGGGLLETVLERPAAVTARSMS